jgi:hypothetical protein
MPSQIGSRMAFQNAANAVKRAGLNPSNAVLSQSYLRLEVQLSTSSTSYKFDVLTNESVNGTINTQQKLNLQDAFVVNQIGFFLTVPTSTTDTTARLLTYPAINSTTATTGTGVCFNAAQAAAAYTLYQGFMQLNVNQRTVMTAWDLYRHLFIPSTQLAGNASASTAALVAVGSAAGHMNDDNFNAADMGMFPTEPNIVLAGNKKNDLTVTLPTAISSLPSTSNTVCRLVCITRGILAQNVTPIN